MEGTAESQTPDLRDVESKVGRKTPEGLLRGLRGEWEPATSSALPLPGAPSTGHGLGDKIVALKMELVSVGFTGPGGGGGAPVSESPGGAGPEGTTQSWTEDEGVKTPHLTNSLGSLPGQSLHPWFH